MVSDSGLTKENEQASVLAADARRLAADPAYHEEVRELLELMDSISPAWDLADRD